jgi:hypothetical protein
MKMKKNDIIHYYLSITISYSRLLLILLIEIFEKMLDHIKKMLMIFMMKLMSFMLLFSEMISLIILMYQILEPEEEE